MEHFKTMEVPATTSQSFTHTTCDLCKETISAGDSFDATENTILAKRGSSYPSGGSGTKAELDLCNECMERVLAWVVKQGGRVEWEKWDW